MATAPRAGGNKSAPVFRIRIKDRTLDVPGEVTIGEKIAVRAATGLPVEAFLRPGENTVGEDSLVVLWWLARRHNGSPGLSWATHVEEWPSRLEEGDIDLVVVTDDEIEADSPEGLGPAS